MILAACQSHVKGCLQAEQLQISLTAGGEINQSTRALQQGYNCSSTSLSWTLWVLICSNHVFSVANQQDVLTKKIHICRNNLFTH